MPDGPNKADYGDPQRVGGKLIYELTLVNVSDLKQTGTIEVIPSAVVTEAKCAQRGVTKHFNIGLYLCGASDTVGLTFAGPNPPDKALPPPIRFTLAAEAATTISYQQVFWSLYGNAPSGCPSAFVRGIVAFKVTVNEDRGAVIGSVTPRSGSHSPSIASGATFKTCGVGEDFLLHYSGDYPDSPAVPVMLNGGRPF